MNTARNAAVETPCIGVCRLDHGLGLCLGCGRTLAEIGDWLAAGPAERRRVMALLPRRLARLADERGRS